MMYTESEIQPFLDTCDAMIRSKFILVDKRIGDLLKSIATTKPVYNAIAECMINFNWDASWKIATNKTGDLVVPEESNKLIAFVFCLLKNIDANKVNINEVLVKYCSNDEDKRSSYVVFCEKTIVKFKQYIQDKLCGPKTKVQVEEQPKFSLNTEVNNRLEFLIKDVKAFVLGIKKLKTNIISKVEYQSVIENFLLAIKNEHYEYYSTFALLLLKASDKDRELKSRINGIIEVISHIQG